MPDLSSPHKARAHFAERQAEGLWRQRRELAGAQGVEIEIGQQRLINFSSNDYLGLAAHPLLQTALSEGARRYGVGSGASQLVCGYSRAHRELEEKLCQWTGRDRALLFSSGYLANQAIITTLARRGDCIFADRLNHASMVDAALLSRARLQRYAHADSNDLSRLLATTASGCKLVATDAVFSMDGDIAPLVAISRHCAEHQALLLVDDAHGFGVLGGGAGTLTELQLTQAQVPLLMATFGKALGTFGAFVAGDANLVEQLLQSARALIYTTAPPPALACATKAALDLLERESWRRQQLQDRIQQFRHGAAELGLPLLPSTTPIQPLMIGDAARALAVSEQLLQQGILLIAMRPPTVPHNSSRLRIVITAAHTQQHIELLLERLAQTV